VLHNGSCYTLGKMRRAWLWSVLALYQVNLCRNTVSFHVPRYRYVQSVCYIIFSVDLREQRDAIYSSVGGCSSVFSMAYARKSYITKCEKFVHHF